MQPTDHTQKLIQDILSFMMTKNLPAFLYTEAADQNQLIMLKVSLKTKPEDKIPAIGIGGLDAPDEEKNIVREIAGWLRDNETTGFTYRCHPAGIANELLICCETQKTEAPEF